MNKVMFTHQMFNKLMLYNEIDIINPIQPNMVYGIHKDNEPAIYDRIMNIINVSPQDALGMATNYYYNTYFKPLKCDELRNDMLALQLMDIAYNTNVETAVGLLQKSLNVLHDKKILEMDGVAGIMVLNIINNTDQNVLNNTLVQIRKAYITSLLAGRPMNGQLIAKMEAHADKFIIS